MTPRILLPYGGHIETVTFQTVTIPYKAIDGQTKPSNVGLLSSPDKHVLVIALLLRSDAVSVRRAKYSQVLNICNARSFQKDS